MWQTMGVKHLVEFSAMVSTKVVAAVMSRKATCTVIGLLCDSGSPQKNDSPMLLLHSSHSSERNKKTQEAGHQSLFEKSFKDSKAYP